MIPPLHTMRRRSIGCNARSCGGFPDDRVAPARLDFGRPGTDGYELFMLDCRARWRRHSSANPATVSASVPGSGTAVG